MPLGNETSQTLDRGVRLLQMLADSAAAGMTITELATRLAVGRPVVYRLISTFTEHDLVRRSEDGHVYLGLGVLRFTTAVHPALREAAAPTLRELADSCGATAHLTIVDQGEALAVAVVEPRWTDYHVSYRVGSRHPVNRGAAGRAIIAGRGGDSEPVSSLGELQTGATGIAAAVLGVPWLEAAVGVVTVGDLDVRKVSALVAHAALELAMTLTHPQADTRVSPIPRLL